MAQPAPIDGSVMSSQISVDDVDVAFRRLILVVVHHVACLAVHHCTAQRQHARAT